MSGNAQEGQYPDGMQASNDQIALMMMNDVHQQDSDQQQDCKEPMANNPQVLMDLNGLQDKLARVSHSNSPTAVMAHEAANADVYNSQDVEAKTQICFDFTKGMCTRGDKCKYSHDIATIVHFNSKEKGICFDYLRNQCHRGLLCRFSHDLSNIAQQCQVYNGAGTRNRTNAICYDFVKGVCQRGTECRYSHDLTLIARTARSNGAGRSTEVCYDYLRGRCSRGAACKYSHSISLLGAPGLLGAALQAQNLQALQGAGVGLAGTMPLLSGSYPGSPVYSPMSSLAAHAARMPLSPMAPPSNLQPGATPTYAGLGTPTAMAAASPSGMMFRKHLAGAAQDALAMLTASPSSPGMMTPTSVDGVNLAGVDFATLNNAAAAVAAAAAAAATNSPHAQQLLLDGSAANLNSAEAALAQLRLAPASEASSMPALQASQAPEMLLPAVSGHDNVMLGSSSPGPHMTYGASGSETAAPSPLSRQSSNAASMAAKLEIPISLPAIKTQAPLHLQMAAAMNSPDMRPKFQVPAESHMPPSRLATVSDPGSGMGKEAYAMPADMNGMFGAFPTSMPVPRYV